MPLKKDVERLGVIPALGARVLSRPEQYLGLNIWFVHIERLSATYDMPAGWVR